MLKTTIHKIRRACTIAFLSRSLRSSRTTVKKFEKFSYAAVYKVPCKSKSDYHEREEHRKHPARVVEFAITPKRTTKRHIDNFENIQFGKDDIITRKKNLSKIAPIKEETECQKCERLIAQVFGLDKDTQRETVQDDIINTLEEVRLQSTGKSDIEINQENPNAEGAKRQSGETLETVSMPSKVLENIAHVNLAHKGGDYYDKVINREIQSSVIYSNTMDMNRQMELKTARATTPNENEETLTQKMETINETPIVESRNTEVEGFNVSPKVLKDKTLNMLNTPNEKGYMSPEKAEEARYDELASHCVNGPDDEIDERLLKEMDSLRASRPSQPGTPIFEEDLVQTEMVKEERNMIEKVSIGVDKQEDKQKTTELNILQRLYPTFDGFLSEKEVKPEKPDVLFLKQERMFSDDLLLGTTEEATLNFQSADMETSQDLTMDRPTVHPHQVLIDPYDKKTFTYEKEDTESGAYDYVPFKDEPMQHIIKEEEPLRPIMSRKEKYITIEEPAKKEFDPKYVVTCNETCPISTDGLTTTAINTETLKSTEAIYDNLAGCDLKKNSLISVAAQEEEIEDKDTAAKYEEVIKTPEETKPLLEAAEAMVTAIGLKTAEIPQPTPQEPITGSESQNIKEAQTEEHEKEQDGPNHSEAEQIEADPKEALTGTLQPQLDTAPLKDEELTECPLHKDMQNLISQPVKPLPKLNDDHASLSELLRRVRERNRMEYCKAVDMGSKAIESLGSQAAVVEPEIGKCGKKPPPCPPPAPKCPPPEPCPPPPCPPPPPPCPKPCKPACPPAQPPCPPKKSPCDKFKKCTAYGIGNLVSSFLRPQTYPSSLIPATLSHFHITIDDDITSNAVLNNDLSLNLKSLGSIFLAYGYRNYAFGCCNFRRTGHRERFVVKDFEPWTPIPSWPIPKREAKRPLVCPKEGCKLIPPPKLNPPCQQNPCLNFPKRMFSLTEYFNLLLNESRLCNLAEI